MKFTKMHGLGNDFVLFDSISYDVDIPPHLINHICDRHYGIGSDGVILLEHSDIADFAMRFFNPDGSEAEICGNGIRCLVKYIFDHRYTDKINIEIETKAGIKKTRIHLKDGMVSKVTANMGMATFNADEIPVIGFDGEVVDKKLKVGADVLTFTALSVGNPHCIIFVDEIKPELFRKIAPKIEHNRMFPNRTNVEFVNVKNRGEIEIFVWERGAGETLASGTCSTSAVAASIKTKRVSKNVTAVLPGGAIHFEMDEFNNIYMTAGAEEVFSGSLSESWLLNQYERD